MMIPLISRDRVIGVLNLQSSKPQAYTEKELRIAERVGNQIAGVIGNVQLFDELKRLEGEREKLIHDLQKALSEELLAKVRNLPFDRLRVNGLRLKLFSFSVRGELVEPQKNTFARGSEVKKLRGFLPICASCKKIRDDKVYWTQIEVYARDHSEAEFSRGICPDCKKRLYGDL